MYQYSETDIEKHLKTHTARSADDYDAVATLEYVLKSNGRIHPLFEKGSTEPNTDGRFELVPKPEHSRRPVQNFFVQIKGTNSEVEEKDGIIKYRLMDLAFPAYVYKEVTLDPGILFVVFKPSERGKERIFWKYVSPKFLHSIDFSQESTTISFSTEDEIKNTDEAVVSFAEKLSKVAEAHSFVKLLESRPVTREKVERILKLCDVEISEAIDRLDIYNDSRDNVSQRMLTKLDDLCSSTLFLHAMKEGYSSPDLRLAWDVSVMDYRTKYLCSFLQSLRYIKRQIPDEGQTERLMLRYFHFLWQIRNYLKHVHGINVLQNLEKFPRYVDIENEAYLKSVASTVEKVAWKKLELNSLRYYVEKKTPFFIEGKRYFEITLELAGKYASKFNRLTVYTKKDISTNYPIRVAYTEEDIRIWGNDSKIKVVTNWKVSIDPSVLNRFAAIFNIGIRLSSNFSEYDSLMRFLTETGMNLLDLVDIRQSFFDVAMNRIYQNANTIHFKKILVLLKENFSENSTKIGRNTVRYLLLKLKEASIDSVLAKDGERTLKNTQLRLKSTCYPFESNPLLYNLPISKLNAKGVSTDVLRAVGLKRIDNKLPFIKLKNLTEMTGQIYFEKEKVDSDGSIEKYNAELSGWDIRAGLSIKEDQGYVWIDLYERDTLAILQRLSEYAQSGNDGQRRININYLKEETFTMDEVKKDALKDAFVESRVMLIYGAAGTGKTTLMNCISNMMGGRSKLFVAKTHTAKENLRRRITAPGQNSKFIGIDQLLRRNESVDYDIVFVDECSTIDNRTMCALLKKLNSQSLLVLAGDIYQIESIDFGNWFFYAKNIIKQQAVVELTNNWRTKKESLQSLWDEVRSRGALITEKLVDAAFSEAICEKAFEKAADDEIVLCLNYDGRFGLNNINNYFQDANQESKVYIWHEWRYKVGDRILFNENKRFPMLYNNLKGIIRDIEKEEGKISFTVDINESLTSVDFRNGEVEFVGETDDGTRIRFSVYDNHSDEDDDERELASMRAVVPFQLAYAVSIHKSQGLEYDSVKVIIPSSNSEKISHGIFYTAITRAKKQLKIYWSAETMTKVVNDITYSDAENVSLQIVKHKFLQR